MVVGFNHNFRYKGELYHVQTEDSGVRNPHIVTLLYTGGTIISSKKTSYANQLQSDNLEKQVEEIMKAQHREMLRRLRDGELDELIRRAARAATAGAPMTEEKPDLVPAPVVAAPAVPRAPMITTAKPVPTVAAAAAPSVPPAVIRPTPSAPAVAAPAPKPVPESSKERVVEVSLDDLILSYLAGDDKR